MMNIPSKTRRLISQSSEDKFVLTTVRISDIGISMQRFFDLNLRGAVIVECEKDLFGYADVSVNGLAYFFKILLNSIFGESIARINMRKELSRLVIDTSWHTKTGLGEEELCELERISKLSGFSLEISRNGVYHTATVTVPIKIMKALPIYAISDSKTYQAFVRVFFL